MKIYNYQLHRTLGNDPEEDEEEKEEEEEGEEGSKEGDEGERKTDAQSELLLAAATKHFPLVIR